MDLVRVAACAAALLVMAGCGQVSREPSGPGDTGRTDYGQITGASDGKVPYVRGLDFVHAVTILKMAGLRPGNESAGFSS